jgi:hypothetical protein
LAFRKDKQDRQIFSQTNQKKEIKINNTRDEKGVITTNTNEIHRTLGNISKTYLLINWKI